MMMLPTIKLIDHRVVKTLAAYFQDACLDSQYQSGSQAECCHRQVAHAASGDALLNADMTLPKFDWFFAWATRCGQLVVLLLAGLFCSLTTRAESFYGVTIDAIFKVDAATGTFGGVYATVVTFASPIALAATLATRPSDGVLFYLDSGGANPNLWRYDPATPAVAPVLVGTTGIGSTQVVRLGFDAAGTLYAMDGGSTFLYTINPSSGAVIAQTPTSGPGLPTPAGGDICVQPSTGTIYMVAGQRLFTLKTTGVITAVGGGTGAVS